ncbi:S-adenosyl-L-methionine-dependent methyltransferase [Penicillium angulare]|uniref:S-adenosyl-L-methionine-dependent methyltransferase n=1 Tax=Penicillium angulare TaxID=116970 RepID=A0A9W9GDF5_9EURO|nr:S-adenosyl-L-methionine-dependent methyltransferase [Penicillium angulare]
MSRISSRATSFSRLAFGLHKRGICTTLPLFHDTKNVWKLESVQDEAQYWDGYLSTRPKYTPEFYDLIYSYHDAHSNSSNLAHDVGCGPGQVSEKLAQQFKHVVLSDTNASHVDFARYALSEQHNRSDQSAFSFAVAEAERLGEQYPRKSTDLVACALTFPLLDTEATLHSFRTLLKPGGTLAIWFYGRAHFSEPDFAHCQHLLNEIIDHHFGQMIQAKEMGPVFREQWKSTAEGIASWLDYIPFHESKWQDVQRYKWNASWTTMGFFTPQACGLDVNPISRVKSAERIFEIEDRNLWRKDWTVTQLKTFVNHIFPFATTDQESVQPIWEQLEQDMGGAHARRAFSWPVALNLASRRS